MIIDSAKRQGLKLGSQKSNNNFVVSIRNLFYVIFFVLVFVGNISAQERKEMQTANMSRAIEAYYSNNLSEMYKNLEAEIKRNDKNGYAYAWLAWLHDYYDEYGYAVSYADKSLQYIPKKDKEYVVFVLSSRAHSYEGLKEYKKALSDYNAIVKAEPSNAHSYQNRGNFYYNTGEYDLSDKDFQKYVSLEPTDPLGYMGLGRNAKTRGNYEEAIKYFDKAIQLRGSDYSSGYSFRAECYIKLEQYDEAAADIVTALSIDGDDKAYYLMQELASLSYRTIVSRLKVQADNEPNNPEWQYYLGIVSEHVKKYDKAIEYYTAGLNIDGNDAFYARIADCYEEKGMFEKALQYINTAIDKNSTKLSYRSTRVSVNYELERKDDIFTDLDFCISQNTSSQYWYYYRRGWYKELFGDREGAIEDYTSCITLNQEYAYVYTTRGKLLLQEGETAAAQKDFQKCIAIDTVDMENMNCAFYAYHYLGDDNNAVRLLDTLLAHDGSVYEAVCLYSLMNDKEKALEYMQKAFDEGYNSFTHIERDHDLDNIRDDERFIAMVAKYKAKWLQEINNEEAENLSFVEKTSEIPFNRKSGVTEVQCSINGLPLYFIFDTGAGDVTISSVEAAFMFKNGYLSDKDVVGRSSYRTASGDIIEGTVINLNKIEFGDMTLNNVRASVVRGQSAPLLLGQSVLSRLGKIEIDNAKQVIKITYQENN